MTPERMAGLVARWVGLYTRDLPAPIAERRTDEIDADLHDHIAHERAHGTKDRRLALSIATRMIRGMAADASWRGRMIAHPSTRKATKMNKTAYVRVALATAFILLLPLVAMQITDAVDWGVADFVVAAALVGGTVFCLSWQRGRGTPSPTEPPPPRSASPPSCSGRQTTRPDSCSSVASSSWARLR